MIKKCLLLIVCQLLILGNITAQCNGHTALCDKKYDEVAYLTTHNAYNTMQGDFLFPNQTHSITQQLNDGVRALMIDVYDEDGVPMVYHSFDFLGSVPLVDNLTEIKNFLMNEPNEIVTIILECYTTADAIEEAVNEAGLSSYLYARNSNADWASLQEMIDADKRLLIFSDVDDASADQNWYHYVWTHAVETHYTAHDTSDFSCDFNRGNVWNDLFILNHFITHAKLGVGLIDQAEIANTNPYFINRSLTCQALTGKFPNFVTVDFYEIGNALHVVNTLNGVTTTPVVNTTNIPIRTFPNPTNGQVNIEGLPGGFDYTLFDISGKLWQSGYSDKSSIDIEKLSAGIYFLRVETTIGRHYLKIGKQ